MTKDHQTETDDLVERLEDSKGWPNLGKAAAKRIRLDAEVIKAAEALAKALDKYARSGTASLICWDDVIDARRALNRALLTRAEKGGE